MHVREATAADLQFLQRMFIEAAHVASAADLRRPELARYFEGWFREGDAALIADPHLGAAWWRFLVGYGFVRADIPELGIAVAEGQRGRGVGARLLRELKALADARGLPGLSLSVLKENPARALYARAGFEEVGVNGGALTMLWTSRAGRRTGAAGTGTG